jgi:hypothetical protein
MDEKSEDNKIRDSFYKLIDDISNRLDDTRAIKIYYNQIRERKKSGPVMLIYCHPNIVKFKNGIVDKDSHFLHKEINKIANQYGIKTIVTLDIIGMPAYGENTLYININGFSETFINKFSGMFDVVMVPDCNGDWVYLQSYMSRDTIYSCFDKKFPDSGVIYSYISDNPHKSKQYELRISDIKPYCKEIPNTEDAKQDAYSKFKELMKKLKQLVDKDGCILYSKFTNEAFEKISNDQGMIEFKQYDQFKEFDVSNWMIYENKEVAGGKYIWRTFLIGF